MNDKSTFFITLTGAITVEGELALAGETVELSSVEAQNVLGRNLGVLADDETMARIEADAREEADLIAIAQDQAIENQRLADADKARRDAEAALVRDKARADRAAELDKMTVDDLKAYAEGKVDLSGVTKKSDIIEAIVAAE